MNIQFGSGVLFGFTATGTPVQFGGLQEVSLEFSASAKQLFGQYQFPIAIGRGTASVNGKAKFADINANALGSLFFNETPAAGQINLILNEAGTVPTTPFQITVAHAADFVDDYGVINSVTGLPYTKVASTPAAGQYSVVVATGVYTFNTADAADTVKISYTYDIAATGQIITINNQLLGLAPTFQAVLQQTYNSKTFTCTLYKCVSSKLSLPTKLEDFVISDFDFGAFCNDSSILGKLSFPE